MKFPWIALWAVFAFAYFDTLVIFIMFLVVALFFLTKFDGRSGAPTKAKS